MNISNGVYLVIDPSMKRDELIEKVTAATSAGLAAVQVWDNLSQVENANKLFVKLSEITRLNNTPFIINNRVDLLNSHPFDGIHFDDIPKPDVVNQLPDNCIKGITCNNDLSVISWAIDNHFDYISFCSVFPSSTSNSCELVSFDSIRQARAMTNMPIFLAGGINSETVQKLKTLDFNGVAVVSGIMDADDIEKAINEYTEAIK
ncbi:MAG: thiamine phosphate synthase [Cryomorphaceae bacterium]|nr:thiamine phosphate synthase [Cryomorphaceae bacterium]